MAEVVVLDKIFVGFNFAVEVDPALLLSKKTYQLNDI